MAICYRLKWNDFEINFEEQKSWVKLEGCRNELHECFWGSGIKIKNFWGRSMPTILEVYQRE